MGFMHKDTPEKIRRTHQLIKDGTPMYKAVKIAGITTDTFNKWKKKFPLDASAKPERKKYVKRTAQGLIELPPVPFVDLPARTASGRILVIACEADQLASVINGVR